MTNFLRLFAITAILLSFPRSVLADVRLPSLFSDHMVIQQEKPIRIWGWADPGESIHVSLQDESKKTTADDQGKWEVVLPAQQADNVPRQLIVAGNNQIEINDVLLGEVWLCSGQSNMEWSVRASANADQEIAAASFPLIRHIKIPRHPSMTPIANVDAQWQVCSPDTVANFTAVGYFMARNLHQKLEVPIGLINSSWGGTRVEPWTPPVGFQQVEALADIYQSVLGRTPGTEPFRSRLSDHIKAMEAWLAEAKQSLSSEQSVSASPSFPAELAPFQSHQDPTMLYNGMIHALVGYPLRGAIWYQGESNHVEGMLYYEKKKALIQGWRELWGQGDFPFYYVQIAPFQYGAEDPTILARFWEAQAAVQQIPNTAMVVINDIATLNDIHPPNKQDVGLRLANLALKNDYGFQDIVAQSPEFAGLQVMPGKLRLSFKNTGGGLKTRDGNPPTHFEVIGAGSRGYRPAKAEIDGDHVILTSDEVENPVAFRFAWHKLAEPNLTGGTGLPVGAVRGGEEPDLLSLLNIEVDHKLVYDIDLGKMSRDIKYDIDNSNQIQSFDRVAYLLELSSNEHADQIVFVSMNPFTENPKHLGIPTVRSGAVYQQPVEQMEVFSTVASLNTSGPVDTGNIEFWPHNYGQRNAGNVSGASNNSYDFGDQPADPVEGYGSMQIHNFGTRQTVLAINHWGAGDGGDLGIGNSPGENPDWTFSGNAGSYNKKRLRVFVRTN